MSMPIYAHAHAQADAPAHAHAWCITRQARISAANMGLKLGHVQHALGEYEEILESHASHAVRVRGRVCGVSCIAWRVAGDHA